MVNAATGLPIRKASVQLSGVPQSFRVMTDAEGRFHFPAVDAGEYAFSVERPGFVKLDIGLYGLPGRSTAIEPGDHLSGVVLKLKPQGLIAGSVLDSDGKPLLSAGLKLWRVSFEGGQRVLRELRISMSVEADGTFVIGGLDSGRYYLAALETPRVNVELSNEMRHEGLTATYYSNTLKFETAKPIDLEAGKEVRNIRLVVQKASLRKISGTLVNPIPDSPVIERRLWLSAKNPLGAVAYLKTPEHLVDESGAFIFYGVPPGDYILQGITKVQSNGEISTFRSRLDVHLGDRDLKRIEVSSFATLKLTGRAVGMVDALAQNQLDLYATLSETDKWRDSTKIAADGSFALEVPPGGYWMFAGNGLQTKIGARSILFEGKEILNAPFEVTSAGGTFKVFFANLGKIKGVVRDRNATPVAGATVALWRDNGYVQSDTSDAVGRFTLTLVPEGSFRIAAWEPLERGIVESRQFRDGFRRQSVEVRHGQTDSAGIDLLAITTGAANAVVANLK